MFGIWLANPTYGARRLATLIKQTYSQSHNTILHMFRNGWVPLEDEEWCSFKSSFDVQ